MIVDELDDAEFADIADDFEHEESDAVTPGVDEVDSPEAANRDYAAAEAQVEAGYALADSDGDGVPDYQELIAGTDPLDPDDVP